MMALARWARAHVLTGLNLLTLLLAVVFTLRIVTTPLGQYSIDFHSFWVAGHFIWEGVDPYAAAFAQREPALPVAYWDGPVVTTGSVRQGDFGYMPGITAPLLLLLAVLSRLSWLPAVAVWMVISYAWLIVAALALGRWLGEPWRSRRLSLLVLLGLCLLGAREGVQFGQSTPLVFGAMLAALALHRRPLWAGLLLGIALSKPTLTFPALVAFGLLRGYGAIAVAGGVQVVGMAVLVALTDATFPGVVAAYWTIARQHNTMDAGMQLSQGLLAGVNPLPWVMLLGMAVSGFVVWTWRRVRPPWQEAAGQPYVLLVMTLVMLVNLLVLYHRRYDFVATLLVVGVVVIGLHHWPAARRLTRGHMLVIYGLTAGLLGIWVLPVYALLNATDYVRVFNVSILAALALVAWLLVALRPPDVDVPADATRPFTARAP